MAGSEFITEDWCAACGASLRNAKATGESSLYCPGGQAILLCEPCFFEEDEAIEEAGTNDLPDRLDRYRRTLAAAMQ